MAFKRLEGHNVLFRAIAISALQFKLVQEIVTHFGGETKLTRKQLRDAHGVLRGKRSAPYFISKNVACKIKGEHGKYNVAVLKLSAEAAKAETAIVPVADAPPVKKTAKVKKEAAKPAKGKKKPAEAPVAAIEA